MATIDRFLQLMCEKGASDLHISSGTRPRFRLHGSIMQIENSKELPDELIHKLMSEIAPEQNKEEFLERKDTDFAYELPGIARFRVNWFTDRNGSGTVIRQIPAKVFSIDDLKLPEVCRTLCNLSKGLVVVTGPTGSGKSTTLAAMIDYVNESREDHIITVEDPIEFVHPNKGCLVNQREVKKHTQSFKSALRAALREDPDIILVGEMRDLETTEIAIETAETGHLVFGTLHTNTAVGTIDRIINQFPVDRQAQIRTMLAEGLRGVIAQTLLKRADGKGRVAAQEIMVMTPAISNCIREGKIHQIASAIQTGRKYGMTLLNDELLRYVKEKLVEPKEAYMKAVDKEDLLSKFKTIGVNFEPPSASNIGH